MLLVDSAGQAQAPVVTIPLGLLVGLGCAVATVRRAARDQQRFG